MNYRHAFHAGNHGDVLKHIVLTRVLVYFKQKQQGFALLDSHAGIGQYDLTAPEAFKTGEWQSGIAKLLAASRDPATSDLIASYLDVVRAMNADGRLSHYPGSPELALRLLRPQDRLLLNELHPQDHATLLARYAHHAGVNVSHIDATVAVKAALPFPEKRGVVLIDPAFEVTDETERVAQMVKYALKRMAHACLLVWYPVTSRRFAEAFCAGLNLEHAKSALRLELCVREAVEGGGLAGSGVVIVNPPWTLHAEALQLLPALADILGESMQGRSAITWMVSPP
jgi:23S rRNA (adenine2030-N6)-methyltransferase